MAPTWHLNMVPIHVSRGVPKEAVGDEAMGVHTVDERKRSLGYDGRRTRSGWALARQLSHSSPMSTIPPLCQGLTMPVSDVKMTISYKGASCWNKVSMPGRFLNLQPVASWGGSKNSETQRAPEPPREQRPSLRDAQNQNVLRLYGGSEVYGCDRGLGSVKGLGPQTTAGSSVALTVC